MRFTSLLLHSEYTIRDGVLCHSAPCCAGVLDAEGPAGAAALRGAVPQAQVLCEKFQGTEGLPRILALAALDGVAAAEKLPKVVGEVLMRLLKVLRKELQSILDRCGTRGFTSCLGGLGAPTSLSHRCH